MSMSKKLVLSDNDISIFHAERMQLLFKQYMATPIKAKYVTYWEEITCVGYHPENNRLEAVVSVKQSGGYSTGLCAAGPKEYVRFFVDYHDGAGFIDAGMTNFKVANIADGTPATHPIQYMAYIYLDTTNHKKYLGCSKAVIPTVKAILSWNTPVPNDPDYHPHYGNVIERNIQLKPLLIYKPFDPSDLVFYPKPKFVDIPKLMEKAFPTPPLPPIEKLYKTYKSNQVPDHRMLYTSIAPMVMEKSFATTALKYQPNEIAQLGIDYDKLIEVILGNDDKADVAFEELVCVGLNSATDTLGAVIHVKKNSGYSGDLCSTGSAEYVAFWADWDNNGSFDEYLGTAEVRVHDLDNIPADGLYYNVALPIDVTKHLRACSKPNVIRIRAVLSWSSLPSTTNPNVLNHWGNRLDALVQVRPGRATDGELDVVITTVNEVSISDINNDGLAEPTAAFPNAMRPFGGEVMLSGYFTGSGAPGTVHYRVEYTNNDGASWNPIMDKQRFIIEGSPFPTIDEQDASMSDGWLSYKGSTSPLQIIRFNVLAVWDTGVKNGKHKLRVAFSDEPFTMPYNPVIINYSNEVAVYLDNDGFNVNPAPHAAGDPLSSVHDIDIIIDGGECNFYKTGVDTLLTGRIKVMDDYFHSWNLDVQPSSHFIPPATLSSIVTPTGRACTGISDFGDNNFAFSIDLTKLDPCGYTVRIYGHDRAILGHRSYFIDGTYSFNLGNHQGYKYAGFSILP